MADEHTTLVRKVFEEAMDGFARVIAGVTPPPEYFAEDSVRRILDAAAWPASTAR